MQKSLQRVIWEQLNNPKGKYPLVPYQGVCATTGEPIEYGVPIESIITDAFSNHADFFPYSDHVSKWCAWWYSAPKETHRSVILIGDRVEFPTISLNPKQSESEGDPNKKKRESYYSLPPCENRPNWLDVFKELAALPSDTLTGGVLTTDPKLRLWPRAQLCTVADFGLFVHFPDYNLSGFQRFNVCKCLEIVDVIIELLQQGFIKKVIASSLLNDAKKVKADLPLTLALEARLKPLRELPEFLPALLIAGIK